MKSIARWPVFGALALVLAAYGWTWRSVDGAKLYRQAQDYYGSLTDALVSGQLYLKTAPDPRLAALANPWASYQGIPRLHDATYFHGRYYLYFGVTPVLVLLGPWRLLTGTFLGEGAAAVIFGLAGFLAGLDLLRRLAARLPQPPGPGWRAAGTLVWGLGTFAFVLMQSPIFYVVPILAAFACLMAALNAATRAAEAAGPAAAGRWLAVASLAWGLAVGGRPHYVFSLPLLGLPLAWLLRRDGGGFSRGGRGRLIAAAVVPAAAVGAFLAWYNWARFGTPLEFGFRYQFTGGDQRFIRMWNPGLILPNLHGYLFQRNLISEYFPFVIPIAPTLGMIATLPLAGLAAALPFTMTPRRGRADRVWLTAGSCILGAGCVHLFCLCILPIGSARYLVDYAPEFILAALLAGAFLLGAARGRSRTVGRILAAAIGALGAVTVVDSVLLAIQSSPDRRTDRALAALLDRPAAGMERMMGGSPGPLSIELSLDSLPVGPREPLVETGVGTDMLYVQRTDPRRVRFGFIHLGDPELAGAAVLFRSGVRHTVVADLGSLYPPDEHPAFAGWSQPLREALHRRVRVTLDGAPVLTGASSFYPSDPLHTYVGRDLGVGLTAPRFAGAIYRTVREGMPEREAVAREGWSGPVRLRLRFPPFVNVTSEPLITTGTRGAGDMIYVTYLAPGRLRFGHDSNGGGAKETADIDFDPKREHTLDVEMASLQAAPGAAPDPRGALQLRFDGRWLIYADRPMHPSWPFEVAFGYNATVMGTARDSFSGTIVAAEHIGPLRPPLAPSAGAGPLEVVVQFPPPLPGVREPLVVTGKTGAGDLVYVEYEKAGRVRFGVDHWGVGGALSDPIALYPQQVCTVTVASAALYPPLDGAAWGGVPPAERRRRRAGIRVELDGRTVIDAPFTAYPTEPGQIDVGLNRIGGSTCDARFTGEILAVRRLGLPPARP